MRIVLTETSSHRKVMYGYTDKEKYSGESDYYDINPKTIILFSGTSEELLQRDEEWMGEIIEKSENGYWSKDYSLQKSGMWIYPLKKSIESALKFLGNPKQVLIIEEKICN